MHFVTSGQSYKLGGVSAVHANTCWHQQNHIYYSPSRKFTQDTHQGQYHKIMKANKKFTEINIFNLWFSNSSVTFLKKKIQSFPRVSSICYKVTWHMTAASHSSITHTDFSGDHLTPATTSLLSELQHAELGHSIHHHTQHTGEFHEKHFHQKCFTSTNPEAKWSQHVSSSVFTNLCPQVTHQFTQSPQSSPSSQTRGGVAAARKGGNISIVCKATSTSTRQFF